MTVADTVLLHFLLLSDWVIVCPYAIFGCVHECKRNSLNDHLAECTYRGLTREEENELRRESTYVAVLAAEEERTRRMEEMLKEENESASSCGSGSGSGGGSGSSSGSGSGGSGMPMLMRVVQIQKLQFQSVLGQEVRLYGEHCQSTFKRRKQAYNDAICRVRNVVQSRWNNSEVHPYGSYASGLMTPDR